MRLLQFVLLFAFAVSCALAQARQSDRDFQRLKGKVKTVQTETADAKMKAGKVTESNRRKQEFFAFRQDGSASEYTLFHWITGELFEATTYIQIDGDKASKSTMGAGVITGNPDSSDKPVKPADPRYEFKYRYKYDQQGRIVEEAWWRSDGDLWLRYVYEYRTGELSESRFDNIGGVIERYVDELDPKGNVSERTFYEDKSGKVEGKERYEYLQFDDHGNWIKRLEYETEEDSTSKFKIREVKYRTITYYQ